MHSAQSHDAAAGFATPALEFEASPVPVLGGAAESDCGAAAVEFALALAGRASDEAEASFFSLDLLLGDDLLVDFGDFAAFARLVLVGLPAGFGVDVVLGRGDAAAAS